MTAAMTGLIAVGAVSLGLIMTGTYVLLFMLFVRERRRQLEAQGLTAEERRLERRWWRGGGHGSVEAMMRAIEERRGGQSDGARVVGPTADSLSQVEVDFIAPEMIYLLVQEEGTLTDEQGGGDGHGGDCKLAISDAEGDDCDTCAVCLDTVHDGDVIRSLPCLHEFHSSYVATQS